MPGAFPLHHRRGHYARLSPFHFRNVDLLNGVSFIPAMNGLFGISEVMRNVSQKRMDFTIPKVQTKDIFTGVGHLFKKYRWNMWRSGMIGTIIGVLPGAGADIAAWIAYAASKRASKEKHLYGKDSSGDSGLRHANNACLARDWSRRSSLGSRGIRSRPSLSE